MSRSKADILKDVRSALEMLERAQYGCDLPGSGDDLAKKGPVSYSFAIGWAIAGLRRALELPEDQPDEQA